MPLHIKNILLDRLMESRFGYLICVDNWHKAPLVSRLLCKIGRHDYEFDGTTADNKALLECFYCEHRKLGYQINRG